MVASPFGLTCIGIREDRGRMSAIGSDVPRHLTMAYALLRHNGVELGKADYLGALQQ